MPTTNPLTSTATERHITALARLYLLTRDSYLSGRAEMAAKLDALAGLRQFALSPAKAAQPPLPQVEGVRLVELLRWRLVQAGPSIPLTSRRLIVVDVLCSTRPPVTGVWARPPASLAAHVATYLDANLSVPDLEHLAGQHRRCYDRLLVAARLGRRLTRATQALPDPIATLTQATSDVGGIVAPAALADAVVLLAGGSPGPTRVGSAVLQRMPTVNGQFLDGYVGTAVARRCLQALVHQVATLEVACALHPDLRPSLVEGLRDVRADLGGTMSSTAGEQLRLHGAARVVDAIRTRLGDRSRSVLRPRAAPTPGGRGAAQHHW